MAEQSRGQTTNSGDLLITSYMRGMARQLRRDFLRGQDMIQATQERHLVLTGQLVELHRQLLEAVMAMQPPAPQPSGRMGWTMRIWMRLRGAISDAVLLHKLLVAWRTVSWPTYGYMALRWLGWL